jgi:hypothetical protein
MSESKGIGGAHQQASERAAPPVSVEEKGGLGSMSGPRENSEKFNTKIMQPLKKVPILRWLSSNSQARYRAFLKHL